MFSHAATPRRRVRLEYVPGHQSGGTSASSVTVYNDALAAARRKEDISKRIVFFHVGFVTYYICVSRRMTDRRSETLMSSDRCADAAASVALAAWWWYVEQRGSIA